MTLTLPEVLMDYGRGNSQFAFVMQGGNQGDRMIYIGADKLAKSLGINYTTYYCPPPTRELTIPIPELDENIIIYMHGGGGFNKWWGWSPRLIKELREKNPKNVIIVGPSSFDLDMEMLNGLPKDIIYFAREKTSYDILKSIFPSVYLDHDTALQLEYKDGFLDHLLSYRRPRENYSLLAIRDDRESAELPKSVNRGDFRMQVDPCRQTDWAGIHLNATIIMTNRCHSAILGSLLGKRTILFPGSYHKNKSIYEYSLWNRNVEWVE